MTYRIETEEYASPWTFEDEKEAIEYAKDFAKAQKERVLVTQYAMGNWWLLHIVDSDGKI